ncbi:bzip transcription factor [Stylonychia lemnae]|uniref:Bzip transcription factor n=1 Tax=Stylonychia lemnae TaxID=5949 RepID=A0A078A5E3_STYLE|nr:bzip transcription factor [Stylonychia lemnae]|eukprot:CDW77389.1 bzip transcription factor [Stylonychia lemnae]
MSITLLNDNQINQSLNSENLLKINQEDTNQLKDNIQCVSNETKNKTSHLGKRQRQSTEALSTNSDLSSKPKRARRAANQKRCNLKNEISISDEEDGADMSKRASSKSFNDDSSDADSRERRLVQNRKSAMKCRLKKKYEFDEMKVKLDDLKHQNIELNIQFKNTCILYEDKIKENESLKEKLDSIQGQQTMMLAYVLSLQQNKNQGSPSQQITNNEENDKPSINKLQQNLSNTQIEGLHNLNPSIQNQVSQKNLGQSQTLNNNIALPILMTQQADIKRTNNMVQVPDYQNLNLNSLIYDKLRGSQMIQDPSSLMNLGLHHQLIGHNQLNQGYANNQISYPTHNIYQQPQAQQPIAFKLENIQSQLGKQDVKIMKPVPSKSSPVPQHYQFLSGQQFTISHMNGDLQQQQNLLLLEKLKQQMYQ